MLINWLLEAKLLKLPGYIHIYYTGYIYAYTYYNNAHRALYTSACLALSIDFCAAGVSDPSLSFPLGLDKSRGREKQTRAKRQEREKGKREELMMNKFYTSSGREKRERESGASSCSGLPFSLPSPSLSQNSSEKEEIETLAPFLLLCECVYKTMFGWLKGKETSFLVKRRYSPTIMEHL